MYCKWSNFKAVLVIIIIIIILITINKTMT